MGSDRSNTRLLATIFLICVVCGSSFNQIGLSGRCSSVIVLNMVQLNEPLSTYSLSSLPFTMGGKAITIPSAGRPTEGMSTSPRLRIFRDIESQTNSLHIPTSAYELPVLPDEEPMVLHTKRLQFAYSMLSRMVVGEVHKNTGSNKLIK